MDLDTALARARARFGAHATFQPREAGLDLDTPPSAVVLVTEELPFDRARALYREAKACRAEVGLTPLIIASEMLNAWLDTGAGEDVTADAFFAERAADGDPAPELEAALDRLGEAAGCDPMTILHRLRPADLEMFEAEGEPLDFDDLAFPDDVREAYHQGLAERTAFLEEVRRNGGGSARIEPLRTYDEATALADLGGGPARVALFTCSPAEALVDLGFGGFNACPSPRTHARVWQRWAERYGAEPIFVDSSSIAGSIARPVATRSALITLAREVVLYDPDALAAGQLTLLAQLHRNASIGFWWD